MKNLHDAGIDNVFFWINPVEKCTSSAVLRQQRKIDVMTFFGLAAPSIMKQVPLQNIHCVQVELSKFMICAAHKNLV
jgi:hypothetical protein